MKYKIGDKVKLTDCDRMPLTLGKIVTIYDVRGVYYDFKNDNGYISSGWMEDKIEGYAFEEGDKVLVKDLTDINWKDGIYIYTDKKGRFLCVVGQEEEYLSHSWYQAYSYDVIKHLPKEDKIEVKLVINGEEKSPTELSEESWLKIRGRG